MSIVRLRRLQADHAKLMEYIRQQPRVQIIQADGDPPELYQLRYQVVGLRQKEEGMRTVKEHLVEIALPLSYPRLPPQCRMLTPVFHPNIAPHAICIGDHWSSGESLTSIVARIGELLSYQSYNTKSPLNGEAARWVDENMASLPLDSVSFVPNDSPVVAPPPNEMAEKPGANPSLAVPEVMPLAEPKHPIDDPDEPIPVEPVHQAEIGKKRELLSVEPVERLEKPVRSPANLSPATSEKDVGTLPEKIGLACPSCGVKLKIRSELLGSTVQCPACKHSIELPKARASRPAPRPSRETPARAVPPEVEEIPDVIPLDEPRAISAEEVERVPDKVRLTCPSCEAKLKVAADLLGKTVRCPVCKNALELPKKARNER